MSFVITKPKTKPKTEERINPYITLIHSSPLIPLNPLCNAIAAPDKPAIRAWLSDVGIPKYQATTAQTIIATIAAHNATEASLGPPVSETSISNRTILLIVATTWLLISVITNTPIKLNTADISTALLGDIARVATHVAMALGASVHPFTKITPNVNNTDTNSMGLAIS